MANAIVGSRIDYCNSSLFVVHDTHVNKLQSIQNYLARIVTQTPRYTVRDLHWLPVWSRLHFKINLITYKAVTFQQPPSLLNLRKIRDIPHDLRSTQAISLFQPFALGFGTRAYANYAPKVWNVLPKSVHCAGSVLAFRKALKTYYFKHLPDPPKILTTITVSCPRS